MLCWYILVLSIKCSLKLWYVLLIGYFLISFMFFFSGPERIQEDFHELSSIHLLVLSWSHHHARPAVRRHMVEEEISHIPNKYKINGHHMTLAEGMWSTTYSEGRWSFQTHERQWNIHSACQHDDHNDSQGTSTVMPQCLEKFDTPFIFPEIWLIWILKVDPNILYQMGKIWINLFRFCLMSCQMDHWSLGSSRNIWKQSN